jgi:uncharacterized protein (TIGR02246 family)
MKYVRMSLISIFLLLPLASPAQTQTKRPSKSTASKPANRNEAEIRELYERWAKAFGARDVNGIMSCYAPGNDLVAYDIVPPLQYVGADAYRKDYEEFLAQYVGPIRIEYRDLHIVAGDDVAFIHTLERVTGTLKNGKKSDFWLRASSGLKKINGKWLIVHDHISVPADLETGKALLDLKP